jgi:hypothetical protein
MTLRAMTLRVMTQLRAMTLRGMTPTDSDDRPSDGRYDAARA